MPGTCNDGRPCPYNNDPESDCMGKCRIVDQSSSGVSLSEVAEDTPTRMLLYRRQGDKTPWLLGG